MALQWPKVLTRFRPSISFLIQRCAPVLCALPKKRSSYVPSPSTAALKPGSCQPPQFNQPQAAIKRPAQASDGDDAMKKVFLILLASFALVTIHGFSTASADGGAGIPLSKLAGKLAQTFQGSITVCFKPDFSGTENCSAADAKPVSGNYVQVGQVNQDKDGNSCSTITITLGFPGSPFPPLVSIEQGVGKVTNYDSGTGSGDDSAITYTGGKCIGSKLNSTGATVASSGTDHFVASANGDRVDFVTTTATDPLGDIGAFNLTGFNLKQRE
jgi:hypothetical protein